jgi:hypothetical protein
MGSKMQQTLTAADSTPRPRAQPSGFFNSLWTTPATPTAWNSLMANPALRAQASGPEINYWQLRAAQHCVERVSATPIRLRHNGTGSSAAAQQIKETTSLTCSRPRFIVPQEEADHSTSCSTRWPTREYVERTSPFRVATRTMHNQQTHGAYLAA